MKKLAYSAMMSYQVTDAEKDQAQKILRWVSHCSKVLEKCDQHLDLVYKPLKENPDIPGDQIFKVRATFRLFRDKVIENFKEFRIVAFKSYATFQPFSSDTQTDKLTKAFVDLVKDIGIRVDRFAELFNNMNDDGFAKSLLNAIANIKKEIAQFQEIVNERIKPHIEDNILNRNWVDTVSEELQEKVEKQAPLTMQLVEERKKLTQ